MDQLIARVRGSWPTSIEKLGMTDPGSLLPYLFDDTMLAPVYTRKTKATGSEKDADETCCK